MGSLFTSLVNSTGALGVFQRQFQVIQNNIANANTPGYVRQDQSLVAMPFDLSAGLPGGVLPGAVTNARSEYLEQSVRNAQEKAGFADQRATDLGQVETLFDLTSTYGVSASLNKFFNSASQLAVNPNDPVSRQALIDQAAGVADSFHKTALGISQVAANADHGIADAVTTINRLAGRIAHANEKFRNNVGAGEDAGLAADLNSALEELSGVANFTLIKTPEGSVNVYLGGQTPLVIASRQYNVQADFSSSQTAIRDANGNDITAQLQQGKLGALLTEKNTTLPGYLTSLNAVAQGFADAVNTQLAAGVDKSGAVPTVDLFSYGSAATAASSLQVTGITADQIAAALPSAPGGNGNALALAGLADTPLLGGFTFTQAYGNLGAQVGRDLSFAKQDQTQFSDAAAQARAQRQQISGVSLDEEAAKLIQYQKSYQAIGKMVAVLSDLTDTVLNMIR
jgi:flagellar hook-associated protein 1 FlgK